MEQAKIFVDISSDGLETLEQNKIVIESILKDEGIESNVEKGVVQYESPEGSRTKDITSIIIASSATVVSIGYAISHVISTLQNKKQVIVLDALEEVRDKDNNLIYDKEGKPVFKIVKSVEVVDPAKKETSNYLLELFKVFRLRISSKE